MLLAVLTQLILAGPFAEAERWSPGTIGGLETPWEVTVSQSEDLVAIVDGRGRVHLIDANTNQIRWTVPVVRSEGGAQGLAAFGPDGLAVAVRASRGDEMRIAILDTLDGTIEPLGSAPVDSQVVDIRWTDDGSVLTRTRERPTEREMGDQLIERTWGAESKQRHLGPFTGHPLIKASTSTRIIVDATRRGLDAARSGGGRRLQIKPRLEVWEDRWDPSTARKLRACPEWSPVVQISQDGRRAYSQGKVRCAWDLETGELDAAWEVPEMPWWSALSPDGMRVVERHGKGTKRFGIVRDVKTGEWTYQIPDLQGAAFTNDHSLLVWTEHRLALRNLADGKVRWSTPLDGEVIDVRQAADARSILVVERMSEEGGLRVRVLDPDGKQRAVISDIVKIRGNSDGGRRLLLEVRADHLQLVDLHNPVLARPPAHLAAITALKVDNDGIIASGDAEGRVVVRGGSVAPLSWRRSGEVRDVHVLDGAVTWVAGVMEQEPAKWYVHHSGPAAQGRSSPLVASGADAVMLLDGDKRIIAMSPEGPRVGPAGKGRKRQLEPWSSKNGGPGPDPELAVVLPGTDRLIAPAYVNRAKAAFAWTLSKRTPGASYALATGEVAGVAADAERVVVVDKTGGGRVFKAQGGDKPVDLAVVDSPGGTCCAGVGALTVAVATRGGEVHVYSASSGDQEQRLAPQFVAPIAKVAVSPDGRWIAVGADSGEIALYKQE